MASLRSTKQIRGERQTDGYRRAGLIVETAFDLEEAGSMPRRGLGNPDRTPLAIRVRDWRDPGTQSPRLSPVDH